MQKREVAENSHNIFVDFCGKCWKLYIYFLKKKSKSKLENQKSTKINVEKWKDDFYLGNFIFLFYGVRNKMF
jgi:hypothetical protein